MKPTALNARPASDAIDTGALEQFATSIAAMANCPILNQQMLYEALSLITEDTDRLLADKARQIGYQGREHFVEELIPCVHRQMCQLKSCRLTASERARKRLMDSLYRAHS